MRVRLTSGGAVFTGIFIVTVTVSVTVTVLLAATLPLAAGMPASDASRLTVDGATGPTVGDTPPGASDRDVGPITGCFAGDGYPLAIGDPPATIDALVHASVLTDPGAGDELGVELAGRLEDAPIVTLGAGVRLDAPGLIATGVNPFAAFDLLYTYELRLPMFDGIVDDPTYESDQPPVGSAADTVPC